MARKSKSNFFLSFLFLRRSQREAISAVYAFLHASDDGVDLGGPEARSRLEEWERELDRCYKGESKSDLGQKLTEALRAFSLPREEFALVLEGMASDLSKNRYASWDELSAYCDKVAGAVGLLCVRIFGQSDALGRDYALELGRALQLTNILRDLGEDARAGRIYLPAEDLRRFKVREEDLLRGLAGPAFMDLLKFEAARARGFFRRAEFLARESGSRRLLAGEIMRLTYQTLLDRVEKAGPEVLERKVTLSLPVRAWASLRALASGLRP